MKNNTIFLICLTLFTLFNIFSVPAFAVDEGEVNKIIKKYIETHPEEIVESVGKYQEKLKDDHDQMEIESAFEKRIEISPGDAPMIGNRRADITIIDFSDFQCPFCSRSVATLKQIEKEYKGKVRIYFKHLPLSFHKNAFIASQAAVAAENQGKFWEYHDKLFATQNEWNQLSNADAIKKFESYASSMKLNMPRFKKDFGSTRTTQKIEGDLAEATKLKINGTPTFFLNGVRVSGARDIVYLGSIIERLEKEKK